MSNYIINFTDPLRDSFIIRPYTSNGPKFPTTSELNDSSIAADSTLLIYGKSHPEYGERTDENLLHLLENFAGASEPVIKVGGMLWHKEVLYYRDSGTGTFYAYTTSWNSITLFGSGTLPNPATPPVGLVDGDYWYDNTGSPTILYQWSADERNIDNWIVRIFDEDSGVPSADPVKELQVYDGDAWDVLPDLTAVNALITTTVSSYLLLDTSNGPLTGDLEISKDDPTLTLTATGSPTFPLIDLVGDAATLRLRGTVNWSMADNTDTLEIRVGNTPGANTHFVVDNVNDYLTHGTNQTPAQYKTNITAGPDNTIPNKLYVDGLVSGAIVGDTFVDGGTFGIISSGSPGTDSGTLTMPYSTTGSPGPSGDLVIPGFDSENIPYTTGLVGLSEAATTVDDALTKAAPLESPTFTGAPLSPNLIPTDPSTQIANKGYVDSEVAGGVASASSSQDALRDVQTGGAVLFSTPFTYTAGNNRLMVFKNGVKQYKDELASSTATFSPGLTSQQILTGLDAYTIVGVSPGEGSPLGTNTWTIDGLHAAEFTAGDTFDVILNGDPASEITYTVASAVTTPGSPSGTTDIIVAGGSPVGIPQTAFPGGFIGINYEFELTVDGVTNTITPVNVVDDPTVDNLITQMQSAIDTVVGAGVATVYLHGGDIRVDHQGLSSGSPVPTISISNGTTSTTSDLFDTNNLVVDGFSGSYVSGSAATWGYIESDGAGSNATSNGVAAAVEFNVTTLGTDQIEFLLV
jgi:hypothetical protein